MKTGRPREDVQKRFWAKVDKKGPVLSYELGTCWIWTGTRLRLTGYGSFWLNGANRRSHRASYRINCGRIPKGQQILHKCDNPSCVRPSHLFLGTNAENMADKVSKKRQAKGYKTNLTVLTEEEVIRIRKEYVKGSSTKGLVATANRFGVSEYCVFAIIHGETWKHLL